MACAALMAMAACKSDSTSAPPSGDCASGQPTSLAIGAVSAPLTGNSLCAAGGAEYVLIPFNSSQTSAKASFDVTATGVGAVGSATFSVLPGAAASPGTAPQLALGSTRGRNTAFEAKLRAKEASLNSLIPDARRRAALRTRSAASRAVIPATITLNQRLELNTNSDDACSNPILSVGRVVALTSKSVVVADTANPLGGFTQADYQSIAETFDNVVDPVMTANFGAPADIDNNGRILLFFTKSVNEMTPAESNGSYVGGFFFGRDLFPPIQTPEVQGCPSSNYGELFYLLVPDPTGSINGNDFSTADVRDIAVSIVAHEYQHLINLSRKIYVSTVQEEFEEVWLNEGLSHVAEELLFYAESGRQSRQDLDSIAIRSSQATRDAFNSDAGANFARYRLFLQSPSTNSPYADNDSLATRGATWAFLRYAVDRRNGVDRNLWFQLVNASGKTGRANLQAVFGPDLDGMFRDWSTSAFTDNVAGVPPRYQQPSWHFRSLLTAMYRAPYPLATVTLPAGTPASVQIVGGGSAFLRFAVPAGGAGQVTWGTVPATVQMTLVRTR
jgi:hypothetical protein